MVASSHVFALLLIRCASQQVAATDANISFNNISFNNLPQVGRGQLDALVEKTMSKKLDDGRFESLEEELQSTFDSMTKNKFGNLDHQAVRYVLHRLFVQRHGWYIRGLDPAHDVAVDKPPQEKNTSAKEWIPTYLQTYMEERLGGKGASLRDLAVLAAILQDLAGNDAARRLARAYEIHGFANDQFLSQDKVVSVVTTYMMQFLLGGELSVSSFKELERKRQIFLRKYVAWHEAEAWLWDSLGHLLGDTDGVFGFDFAAVTDMVTEIGERYHTFNDLECQNLKSTLLEVEGQKPGRVRLSTFYKKGLYSHWRFTEKAEYLRSIGVLDEFDPEVPHVIVSNYVLGRGNCLDASSIYALCCRNECEDILGRIESSVGAPETSTARIAELVAALPSSSVFASKAGPRELAPTLLARLNDVAEANHGRVPLHGRLFAQWLHHAYPRECPFPHAQGSISPQSPNEWMQDTGHATNEASEEERTAHVERDTCAVSDAGNPSEACAQETSDLPWSGTEELLHTHTKSVVASARHALSTRSSSDGKLAAEFSVAYTEVAVCIAGLLMWLLALDQRRRGANALPLLPSDNLRLALLVVALALVAYSLDILDGVTVACASVMGPLMMAARCAADHFQHKRQLSRKLQQKYFQAALEP